MAIALHKPLDAVSITSLMLKGGWTAGWRHAVNGGFALMCPLGAFLFVLGIEVQGDAGTLFAMAWVVLIAASVVAWIRRRNLPVLGSLFQSNGESLEPVSAG